MCSVVSIGERGEDDIDTYIRGSVRSSRRLYAEDGETERGKETW